MIDVNNAIRTAVVQKLRNNVTLEGTVVRVYARVAPVSSGGNYIYVPMQSSENDSAKQYFSTDNTMDIECVYRSVDGTNINPLDSMVGQVLNILAVKNQSDMPQPVGLGLTDFRFVRKTELIDYDGTYTILRAILTFEALIDEG